MALAVGPVSLSIDWLAFWCEHWALLASKARLSLEASMGECTRLCG